MSGFTISERHLAKLARKSFLSIWSYGNLHRDQRNGRKDGQESNSEGKELCDLLVVFGNNIIIFSDKNCAFNEKKPVDVAWKQWYKKSIEMSAKQIYGAERWIKDRPDHIFIDASCTIKFPIQLPDLDAMKVYRVAVTRPISKHCKKFFKSGSGSLIFNSTITDNQHTFRDCKPFNVGIVNSSKGYIHIFDEISLDIIFEELNTISDFIKYLESKERLLDERILISTGEEDTLAFYLMNGLNGSRRGFGDLENKRVLLIDETLWENYKKSPMKANKSKADKISFIWDDVIEEFSQNAINGTQYSATSPGISGTEPAIRMLAMLNRFERRLLAETFHSFMNDYDLRGRFKAARIIFLQGTEYTAYVILFVSKLDGKSYESYRKVRIGILQMYCEALKMKFPKLKHVVVLGFDSDWNGIGSEDLMYANVEKWDAIPDEKFLNDIKEVDILQGNIDADMRGIVRKEYPSSPEKSLAKGRRRNKLCSCGSKRKFKNCCGSLL